MAGESNMARNKSDFLIFKAIADAVISRGGGDDDLRRIVIEKGLAGKIADVIMAGRLAVDFIIEVVYGLVFEAMVAAGHYDYRNSDITEAHFPTLKRGTTKFEAVLVHLARSASTKEDLAEIERRGLIPASAAELLAFGAKYPDEQREYPIVAIGQSWRNLGHSFFPCLCFDGRERRLTLLHDGRGWSDFCRFLALREIPS